MTNKKETPKHDPAEDKKMTPAKAEKVVRKVLGLLLEPEDRLGLNQAE